MDGIKRLITPKINELLQNFPILVILGVRQCGKSTLAKALGPHWKYFDLENPTHFNLIENDPVLFFKENHQHIIIDEAQISPKLFKTLRGVVDENRSINGRFILTGSASFELIKNVSESLAGRVATVELSPMKMDELLSGQLNPFYKVFEKKITSTDLEVLKKIRPTKSINEIKKYLLKGGYPQPVLKEDSRFFSMWMQNYFDTYINRDVRSLFPRIDFLKYQRVIRMLSSLSGTIINKSEVARSVETSEKSIRDYLQIIEGTFLWRELPAFKSSKDKTAVSTPKGHYRDTGLLFYLQNIQTLDEMNLYPKLGNIFESFIVEEIIRGIQCTDAHNLSFSHFRTKAGGEIDLIIQGSFGMLPIEIKFQSNTTKKQLIAMSHFIDTHNLPYGIVFNNCDSPSLITEKIIQLPVGCL